MEGVAAVVALRPGKDDNQDRRAPFVNHLDDV
jgi:hypothetical protein